MEARAWRRVQILLALLVLAVGMFRLHNLDIELHARTGEWIVQHGRVPDTNVLSHLHRDHPAVNDKWGFQVVAHLLHDHFGPDACNVARIVLLAALFAVLAGVARRLGADPWWTLLWLVAAALAARSRFTFRPDLVSLLFTAIFAGVLATRPLDRRRAGALLVLQVLWVNTHGYFLIGPLLIGAAAAGRWLGGRAARPQALAATGLCAAALLACLLNPAGVAGALHPVDILTDLRAHYDFYSRTIIEFRPTFAEDPREPWDRLAFFVLGAGALLLLLADALAALRRRVASLRADSLREGAADDSRAFVILALVLLLAAFTPSLRRNMAPFALVAAPFAAAAATRRLAVPRRLLAPLAGAAAALLAWGELSDRISIHDGLDRRAGWGRSSIAYPDAGIDFIAEQLPQAGVFTAFSWGSTFTGRRWPEQSAATDGNTHGYPTAYLIEIISALSGSDPQAFRRICARDGHSAALLPLAGPLSSALLSDPDWALVCVGRREAVWVLRSSVSAEWLSAHDLPARWRAGERPILPDTPRDAWLGSWAARAPIAELDQALLLAAAGLPGPARVRAEDAVALAPRNAEAQTLVGVLAWRLGDRHAARERLQRGLALPGHNRLAEAARNLLEQD